MCGRKDKVNNLILLTNFYPYGSGEPYLETEVKYYEDYFDNVYVCSLQLRPKDLESCRKLPSDKFKVLPIPKASNIVYLLYAFRVLADKNLYRELRKLADEHRLSLKKVILLFVYLSRSYYEAGKIRSWLKAEGVSPVQSNGVLYAYRFEYQPYVSLILKRILPNYVTLARGHRFDLYEEFRKEGYIPLRECLLDNLHHTVMIAQDGINYLSDKYPDHISKLVLSRLGTTDYGLGPVPKPNEPIMIVSCSTITDIKRVNLIVEALALITDIDIVWDHYGDGPNWSMIEAMAKMKLGSNIRYKFHGFVDNASLMKVYSEVPYHAFINVSISEGVPVSIMEALSFGIPTIATDVGGTNEIVFDGRNGFLLPADFELKQLVKCIMDVYQDASSSNSRLRLEARKSWAENYSAEVNYQYFLSHYFN